VRAAWRLLTGLSKPQGTANGLGSSPQNSAAKSSRRARSCLEDDASGYAEAERFPDVRRISLERRTRQALRRTGAEGNRGDLLGRKSESWSRRSEAGLCGERGHYAHAWRQPPEWSRCLAQAFPADSLISPVSASEPAHLDERVVIGRRTPLHTDILGGRPPVFRTALIRLRLFSRRKTQRNAIKPRQLFPISFSSGPEPPRTGFDQTPAVDSIVLQRLDAVKARHNPSSIVASRSESCLTQPSGSASCRSQQESHLFEDLFARFCDCPRWSAARFVRLVKMVQQLGKQGIDVAGRLSLLVRYAFPRLHQGQQSHQVNR